MGLVRVSKRPLHRRAKYSSATGLGQGMIHWVLVASLVAVTLLIAAEGSSRWWLRHRSRYYVWPPRTRLEIRLAPEAFPELESRVRFEVNAAGERGGEVPRVKNGLYRVLAVGGSAVECFTLDQS